MIDSKKRKQAKNNFDTYLGEGLIKKSKNPIAQEMYTKNADMSINVAADLLKSPLKPHLWTIVVSYYAMFYSANAVLLKLGYKVNNKIVHKVTHDALIVLVLDKLTDELLEEYEVAQQEAMELASVKAESVVEDYGFELDKRSRFQYNMLEEMKESKAKTSFERAKRFVFEMNRLLK